MRMARLGVAVLKKSLHKVIVSISIQRAWWHILLRGLIDSYNHRLGIIVTQVLGVHWSAAQTLSCPGDCRSMNLAKLKAVTSETQW